MGVIAERRLDFSCLKKVCFRPGPKGALALSTLQKKVTYRQRVRWLTSAAHKMLVLVQFVDRSPSQISCRNPCRTHALSRLSMRFHLSLHIRWTSLLTSHLPSFYPASGRATVHRRTTTTFVWEASCVNFHLFTCAWSICLWWNTRREMPKQLSSWSIWMRLSCYFVMTSSVRQEFLQ